MEVGGDGGAEGVAGCAGPAGAAVVAGAAGEGVEEGYSNAAPRRGLGQSGSGWWNAQLAIGVSRRIYGHDGRGLLTRCRPHALTQQTRGRSSSHCGPRGHCAVKGCFLVIRIQCHSSTNFVSGGSHSRSPDLRYSSIAGVRLPHRSRIRSVAGAIS